MRISSLKAVSSSSNGAAHLLILKGGEGMAKEWQNSEGYADPTAYKALKNIEDKERVSELIFILKWIIRKSGFELVERIKIVDPKSGKVYW